MISSTYYGCRQVALDQTQLKIMSAQDEILNRRAELVVSLVPAKLNPPGYDVVVTNIGRRAVRDFDFIVRTEADNVAGFGGGLGDFRCERSSNGLAMAVMSGAYSSPLLYPTRSVTITSFGFWDSKGQPVQVEWQIISEDGVFPPRGPDAPGQENGTFGVVMAPGITDHARPADWVSPYCKLTASGDR